MKTLLMTLLIVAGCTNRGPAARGPSSLESQLKVDIKNFGGDQKIKESNYATIHHQLRLFLITANDKSLTKVKKQAKLQSLIKWGKTTVNRQCKDYPCLGLDQYISSELEEISTLVKDGDIPAARAKVKTAEKIFIF